MTKISNQYSLTNVLTADVVNGRVGVNNTSPTVALDVTGAATFSSNITASEYINVKKNGSDTAFDGSYVAVSNAANNVSWAWQLGASNKLSLWLYNGGPTSNPLNITTAGNVGIGTSSPSQKLEVIGTTKLSSAEGNVVGINIIPGSQTNIYQTIGNGNGGARFHASIETSFAAYENAGSSQMLFKTETKGSGTTDLSVVQMVIRPTGDIRMTSLVGSGSRAVMADANGQLSASVSDITLKENITPIGYGLNEIMQMNPVWFDFVDGYKNYGEGRQNGNIAQEIEAIIPEAVFTTPQTGKMGINYEQLHAVYIKAIQELSADLTSAKQEIELLKAK